MARKPSKSGPTPVEAFEHADETRANIPTADGAERWVDPSELDREPLRYSRSHDFVGERAERNEALDPQLVWRGKDTQDDGDLVVDAPPLYIQEKIDPRVLVENLRTTAASGQPEPEATLFDLFDGDLDELQQIEYYQHDAKWTNRMILGDSLQAMGSLAERENLRGKVQMIYIDPPYGIKFNSNWQVSARKRDVKDGKDAAREAEQIKAFRDTWSDGIHTYLSYLRDRLVAARDLLTESGSVFVQIGDENVHLVRALLDEVFGAENFSAMLSFRTKIPLRTTLVPAIYDHILWYGKSNANLKFRRLFKRRRAGVGSQFTRVEVPNRERRSMTRDELLSGTVEGGGRAYRLTDLVSAGRTESCVFEFDLAGRRFFPSGNKSWKTNPEGMRKLILAGRVEAPSKMPNYVFFADDYPVEELDNVWSDTQGALDRNYVVQTASKVIERCMLMTTDPGDLVLDPTCGSGTTAFVAEQWGRRWITMDTSRVALALARQRLMGGRYPYYLLADTDEGRKKQGEVTGKPLPPASVRGDLRQGFVYDRVPHVTLGSITNNPDIREGMTRDEIDAAIKRHADYELLYDKPYEDKKRVRVTGPFTVESLSPYRSLDQNGRDTTRSEQDGEAEPRGADYAQTILDNLQTSGIQNGRRQERIEFISVEPHAGTHVQAIGERAGEDDAPSQVAIAVGPEYGTVSAAFVRDAAREALDSGEDVDLLCVLGFAFDPNVTSMTGDDLEVGQDGAVELSAGEPGFANVEGERKLGKLKVLMVRMNADLLMGEALKKTGSGNLFTVFGEPDVDIRNAGDQIEVELRGVDVYDAAKGDIRAADTSQVALWMIDTDYNEESFFVRHCYFTGGGDPMKKLKTALKADIDADAWAQLYRTTSIPFAAPSTGKIAVKVINDYGDEVMKVYEV